jgi:phage portal protein BeeE
MPSLSQKSASEFHNRVKDYVARGTRGQNATMASGVYGGTGMGFRSQNDARYYRAFRDVAYTAIRPIATRFATQGLKIATIPVNRYNRSLDSTRSAMTKELRDTGHLGSKFESRQKTAWRNMPHYVKSLLPENAVVLDAHEFLDTMARPNEVVDGYTTMELVAISLMTAGRSLLLWDSANQSQGGSGEMTDSVYYIPMDWATPNHSGQPFQSWTIRNPRGGTVSSAVRGEFVYFNMPDPEDPFGAVSPMIASNRQINTSDKIADATLAGLNNLIAPSYAIIAGDVVSQTAGGGVRRPKFTKEQRAEITNGIKQYVQGVMRSGEPVVLDALISDIKDISPKSNDISFVQGSTLMERRIMQSYGVSNVIAGFAENANRASSNTAHEIFYDVVLNPLLVRSGMAFTHWIGPKYNRPAYRVMIYHEPARIDDADATFNRVSLFADQLSPVEKRKYARTGEVDWTDEDVPEPPTQETNIVRRGNPLN